MTRFVILGAGGIGTALGVLLGSAGARVALVTQTEAEAAQIRTRGAQLDGERSALARPEAFSGGCTLTSEDILLLGVKAHQSQAALASTSGVPAAALSLQNGLDKQDTLAEAFGSERTIGSVIQVTATLVEPGYARCSGVGESALASLTAATERTARELALLLSTAGVPTRIVPDITPLEWTKAAQWLGSSMITAATGLSLPAVLRDPRLCWAYQSLIRECSEVADAYGYQLEEFPGFYVREVLARDPDAAVEFLDGIGRAFAASSMSGYRTAMELDLAAGRPPELEPTAGVLLRAAAAVDVSCPTLQTLYGVVRARAAAMAAAAAPEPEDAQ